MSNVPSKGPNIDVDSFLQSVREDPEAIKSQFIYKPFRSMNANNRKPPNDKIANFLLKAVHVGIEPMELIKLGSIIHSLEASRTHNPDV